MTQSSASNSLEIKKRRNLSQSKHETASQTSSATRTARHDVSSESLMRHFSPKITGHESIASQRKAKREATMRDAQENYEIMMEFYRELSDAFSKIIGGKS